MKKKTLILAIGLLLSTTIAAQDSPFARMEVIITLQRPPSIQRSALSAEIKDIQKFDGRWGIAYTADAIFRTANGGATWDELSIGVATYETIGTVRFADHLNGYAILSNLKGYRVTLLRTRDGGGSWERENLELADFESHEADPTSAELVIESGGRLEVSFRITTSSNFSGVVRYISPDDGHTWRFAEKRVDLRASDEPVEKRSGNWTIITEGTCAGFKTGCVQETRILAGDADITPPRIAELARIEKEKARSEITPMFALPPGGATRISLNRGFDKCQAGSVAQMQIWWDNSPHYDSNLYMSGRNRACPSQPFTNNPAWINSVSAQGWGFIPTIVGYQSPCTASMTTAKFSYDVAIAEQQGRGEADIAVTDANNIGLTTGSVLYYDMERYDETVSTPGCRTATLAFLKGWTERIHELGYISGVYGSPFNADPDWASMPAASRMDAIWMARWDNVPSVWTYVSFPTFPSNVWNNHQRIKQWQSPHNETWGGVIFNIDGNIADGPVAGIAVAKNRTADFDGDRKTDISVFRPDNGVWYVQKSNGTGYIITQFGLGTDIPTPADYDGDGRTDQAVFRPSNGTWHTLTKAGVYTARQFGATGDIPAAADYNGDGKADLAVFRPSTGVWYIWNSDSLGTYTIRQFGLDGDKPVQADYDGDGRADIAVWRPSSGVWYVLRSSDDGFTAVAFGISTDRPAEGDYDGDGKTDFAVLRDGTWYLLQSTSGFSQFQFGIAGDIPVTGDFDGDGRDDAAVFRPSTGVWYLLQSQNGFYALQFGVGGDKPVPNSYLPQ
ncbi:MAG: glycoside hydrolase domain-containing protein [Acidobacteriota bacterium]